MPKDPVLRFLAGCAVVVAIVAAIIVGVALLIGWQLTRDEASGRAREMFFVGDETRYWCLDLRPDDAGLAALFARFDEINEATRRDLVRGTFLEAIPFPHRRARLDEIAPLTVEFSQSMSDPANGLPVLTGWAARGTFSRGLFRLRLAFRVMRFFASRNPDKGASVDVDGVAVTSLRDNDATFAFATVGNRVLIANDASRMRAILKRAEDRQGSPLSELFALHREIAIEGEDAWAFASRTRLSGMSKPFVLAGAAASFDVNDRDELAFRLIVADGGAIDEASPFPGTPEDCAAVVASFLPGVPVSAIQIDGGGARSRDHGKVEFSGRISGVSKRFAELLAKATAFRLKDRRHLRLAPETPSATPTPPIPPPPSDPRSGTPAGPPRGGTPTPRR